MRIWGFSFFFLNLYNLDMADLTKKALSFSLKELLKEKTISKITINDICEKAGVRRQTFYYHFADLPELVEWTCYTEVESVLKENRTYNSWQEGFLDIFKLAKKRKKFLVKHLPWRFFRISSELSMQTYFPFA